MLRLRHILRSKARPSRFYTGPQTITAPPAIRHVRFRRPWLRSFIGKCLLYGAAFHLWSSFVLLRFDDDTQDDESSTQKTIEANDSRESLRRNQGKEGQQEEDDDLLFIPLSWSRVEEDEVYSTSGPEWQEFCKISGDEEKYKKLKNELLAIILKTATEQMQPFLGSPLALTADWLQPNFPSRPPPGYMRSGIALTDDGISWVTQPLDPEIGDRLQTFMKPVHVALAIKDAYYVLLKRQMDRLRNPDGQPGSVKLLDGRVTLSGHERTNALSTQEQAKLQPPVSDAPTETVSNDEPQLHPSSIISFLQRLPLPDLGPGSDLHLASIAFKLRLHEHQAKSPRTPNRGSFFLVGPVGLQGPKGACRFEVRGEYDPAKPGWRTVDMKLRDWSYYVHKPRR
ncbi:uncharacterized protein N7469_000675 [Penicillium citrinum]|uniref:Uncharacterized protein n=1 Tax=Penicillium citrinum TaxID=5077 RepID=A0A9W9TV44_PENCI|nr:uncharacterized protein N7469_000675 [Penicillium citrinum]KAJ5242348.1 hypothetical protein N7469_000675 [Penicillium citrinum]